MIQLSSEAVVAVMFIALFVPVLLGFPLGFALMGVGAVVGFLVMGTPVFGIVYGQAFSILTNYTLVAVPLFVFMGVMVERSGIASSLFTTLEMWLYRLRGYLAVVVVLTGTALAACTGIIAGSVVMLASIGLPYMMAKNYNKELTCGAICAGGCLGILIPPSVMLVLYGTSAELSVGRLFMGAIVPGLLLSGLYILYILIACLIKPSLAPSTYDPSVASVSLAKRLWLLVTTVFPLAVLILGVLGSIFLGIAAPTEAAAVGAIVATILALSRKGLNFTVFKAVILQTAKMTGMIAIVAIGAMVFTAVLIRLGGAGVIRDLLLSAPGGAWGLWIATMLTCFVLGMFIDWIGVVFIVVPLITPAAAQAGFDPIWFAITICVNLQLAFMTPPFALAIFFLRGVARPEHGITTAHIIRGVIPFIVLIFIALGLMVAVPEIVLWLPAQMIR